MQTPHGNAHFMRAVFRKVMRLDREEAERVVTPIIPQALLQQIAILDEGMDRQQLDRRDAEAPKMIDDLGFGQRRECAALIWPYVLAQLGEAAQMRLVD